MTARNPKAVYACINREQAYCPAEISGQSVILNMDILEALAQLTGSEKTDV